MKAHGLLMHNTRGGCYLQQYRSIGSHAGHVRGLPPKRMVRGFNGRAEGMEESKLGRRCLSVIFDCKRVICLWKYGSAYREVTDCCFK
jgi:hypothetical protein